MSITIGLSRGSGSPKYKNYWNWIRKHEPDATIIDLFIEPNFEETLPKLDALILTGGGDIHPDAYHMPKALNVSNGIDRKRDEREFHALEYSFNKKLPVLGVCRGIQTINVHLGAPLIPHIPDVSTYQSYHLKLEDGGDNSHKISVEPGSLLYRATGELEGTVNSAHHQGVKELAQGLTATATSPDGLIEAIEWQEPEHRSFLLAVQWHPERMDQESPFARRLIEQFLVEAHSSKILQATSLPEPKTESTKTETKLDNNQGEDLLPIIN